MLGLGLSLTTIAIQGRRPSLAALFANGEQGFLAANFAPGHAYQDAAGTIPTTSYGQPVGLVKRGAGTVDAAQSVALSRPTLARWPKGGRRNLLTWTEDFSDVVWSSAATSNVSVANNSANDPNGGQTAATFTAGVGAGVSAGVSLGQQSSATQLGAHRVSIWVRGVGPTVGKAVRLWWWFSGGGAATGSSGTITPILTGEWQRIVATPNIVTTGLAFFRLDTGVGFGSFLAGEQMEIWHPQLETGPVATPYQRVTTHNDVTEAGVPDVWHLYDDGGDSLPVTVPAGTYGLAYVDVLGVVTVTTETSDGSTPIDLLRAQRMAGVVLRQGAFSPEEETLIRGYWA